jgi:hypothetical protein
MSLPFGNRRREKIMCNENNEEEEELETLTFDDIDILESIGSDLCEGIRDLVYNLKEMRNDIENIKKHTNMG